MKPCQFCLAENAWPICSPCQVRMTRFMSLVGRLTHFNIPHIRFPRMKDTEAPLPRRREKEGHTSSFPG